MELVTAVSTYNVNQNHLALAYYTTGDNGAIEFQLFASIERLKGLVSWIDLTMVVEIKNANLSELTLENMPSNLLDVVGCKVRLDEASGILMSSVPIDAYTTSSAYTDLNNLLEDSSDG